MSDEVKATVEAQEDVGLKIAETEKKEPPVEVHPAESAAMMFDLYFPIYKNILRRLSKKQLIRLHEALVEVPLNSKNYKMLDNAERQTYLIGDKLLQSKWSMILYTLMEHHEQLRAATEAVNSANNQLKIEDVKPSSEGENNG